MKECIDITEHYLNISTPGFGEIIKQEGYNDSLHSNEISMAEWIIKIRSLQFLDIKNENTPSPIRVKVYSHLFYTILFPDYQPQF